MKNIFNILKKTQNHNKIVNRKISKVLIVDDYHINRYILNKYINKYDSTIIIDEVSNGLDAIEKYILNKYDLIFMDIKMPGIDGIETTKRIRNIDQNVIICGITGQVEESVIKLALKAGMLKCIGKPIEFKNIEELFLMIMIMITSN